jgi:hypothetical protein
LDRCALPHLPNTVGRHNHTCGRVGQAPWSPRRKS